MKSAHLKTVVVCQITDMKIKAVLFLSEFTAFILFEIYRDFGK